MELGSYGWNRNINYYRTNTIFITMDPVSATSNYGVLNIGSGPFDGLSVGHFSGSTAGTKIAINAASSYLGNLLDLQLAGSSKFSVTNTGAIVVAAGTTNANPGLISTQGGVTATHLSMQSPSATWALSTGSETISYFYVGGFPTNTKWFWRANWNDTAVPSNSFQVPSGATNVVTVGVIAASGQTADLQQWQNSVGTPLAKIDNLGNFTAATLTATNLTGVDAIAAWRGGD